ncbi:palmitoyl-protein thioesterase 1 [Achlya hypogyna]|uniref:Palmitoyl-protein thioesterase 1 n=1 Tax=Achlya hypogyna TaxID=1202772 RepID=A0A0A7CP41_ACHHY|nr:secreted protein [Achlya hypogyna]OQR97597.1 palmitoyl-protein thioesterase 1 [Achlya hypogyna]
MLQSLVVRILLMAVSGSLVWEVAPPPVAFRNEYIIDVPTVYVDGPAAAFFPVVMMHGMNDAGHNRHMERMRNVVSETLDGAYVTNVQIGKNVAEDEYNSVHLTMDEQVARFATIVAKDPNLRKGFHGIGFSQGGLILRAYIERYNDPPVIGLLACHSPLAGIGALPICNPNDFFCRQLNNIVGAVAYSDELQEHLAQSNYYRDPTRIQEYLEHVRFLPDLNNERAEKNATYSAHFSALRQLVLVRALRDTQVAPSLSSWFGGYQDGDWSTLLEMNETSWYTTDAFGLRTLDAAGKVTLYTTPGDHLQFSDETLADWVSTHFRPLSMQQRATA